MNERRTLFAGPGASTSQTHGDVHMPHRLMSGGLALLAALLVASGARAEEKKPAALAVGDKVPNSESLRDLKGNRRSLLDFKGHKAVVLVFLGTECPVSNLYVPSLLEMEKKYRPQEVQFLAVYANEHDDLDRVGVHTYDRNVPFPVLKGMGQKLAGLVGVKRVPTV